MKHAFRAVITGWNRLKPVASLRTWHMYRVWKQLPFLGKAMLSDKLRTNQGLLNLRFILHALIDICFFCERVSLITWLGCKLLLGLSCRGLACDCIAFAALKLLPALRCREIGKTNAEFVRIIKILIACHSLSLYSHDISRGHAGFVKRQDVCNLFFF